MKYTTQLTKLGFSDKEALVYLASLRVGNARVSRIAEEARLPKSTTSDVLESLLAKGLVSRYTHKNRFHFSAADPELLRTWLARKQAVVDDLVPKLRATQHSAGHQANVRSFFDKDGLYVIEREILEEATEILLISPGKNLDELLPEHFPGLMISRLKKRIRARILIEESAIANYVQSLDAVAQHQTRTLRPAVPFESLMFIWKNKVATVSLDDAVTIVILEDMHVAHMFRSLFELLWSSASIDATNVCV